MDSPLRFEPIANGRGARFDRSVQDPQPGGQAALVRRFHVLRAREFPPVMVVQGVRGIGKSSVLNRCQAGFRRERKGGRDLDARLNLATVNPDPESCYRELTRQLRENAFPLRPARTPRLKMLLSRLDRERGQRVTEPPAAVTKVVLAGVDSGAKLAGGAAGLAVTVKPSLLYGLRGTARRFWPRLGLTSAARWVREFERSSRTKTPIGPRGAAIDALYMGLTDALVEDLVAMHTRRWRPIHQLVLFVEAYDRAERRHAPFLFELAHGCREQGAPLFMVVSSRGQQHWTEWLEKSDADRRHDFGPFKATEYVEIHELYPLSVEERHYELARPRVPASLCAPLAEASHGLPLAIGLLGELFGRSDTASPDWQRDILHRLPPRPAVIDDAWVQKFCSQVVPALVKDMTGQLRLHAMAAATLRTFDRGLLAAVLEDGFSGECYRQLVSGPLTHAWRPSGTLSAAESYRVRSFIREFLSPYTEEPEAVGRWHQRALDHFERLQGGADQERGFELEVERVYHRLSTEPEAAQQAVRQEWMRSFREQRLDRCEMLLDAVSDAARFNRANAASTLCLAGQLYLAIGNFRVAEERLLLAQRSVIDDRALQATIAAALANLYRREFRRDEAEQQLDRLGSVAGDSVALRFHIQWLRALLARNDGQLDDAARYTEAAQRTIALTDDVDGKGADADAQRFGLGPLSRRDADLARHAAELARRRGDLRACAEAIEMAARRYDELRDLVAIEHTSLVKAQLRRGEGDVEAALELAVGAAAALSEPETHDVTGAMIGARVEAQTALDIGDEARAADAAWRLIDAGREAYPPGRTIGYFVLAELARRAGQQAQAERHYLASIRSAEGRVTLFERVYGRLGLAELHRERGEMQIAQSHVAALLRIQSVLEHPTVRFTAHLIDARAARGTAQEHDALERCHEALAAVSAVDDRPTPHHRMLAAHVDLEPGVALPALELNLP